MRDGMSLRGFCSGLALACALSLTPAAKACVMAPPAPPVWVVFHEICCDFVNPSMCYIRAWLIFHNFRSFGATPGQFCSCALNKVGPIRSIEKISVIDLRTHAPLLGLCFEPAPGASSQLGSDFQGSVAAVSRRIPTGVAVDLMVEVTLDAGASFNQLATALSAQGILVTGEGRPDGSFTGGHLQQTRPGLIEDGTGGGTMPIRPPGFEPIELSEQ